MCANYVVEPIFLFVACGLKMIIAIDGPSGSGKSSTARAVADIMGALFMDTGAMYRAAALFLSEKGVDPDGEVGTEDLAGLDIDVETGPHSSPTVRLCGKDVTERIREEDVTMLSSHFSSKPIVRSAMVAQQRALATRHIQAGGSVVMEGRDIGTVVFPEAEFKFFMVADPAVRAHRRTAELRAKGEHALEEDVLKEMTERDRRDSQRDVSPLQQASGAVVIDTSGMSFEDQVDLIIRLVSGNEPV